MKRNKKVLCGVFAAVAVVCLAVAVWYLTGRGAPAPVPPPIVSPSPSPVVTPSPTPSAAPDDTGAPIETDALPVGKLVITPERQAYEDGSLSLYIPAIGITRTLWSGTDEATLSKGVGLYDYAQLPGEGIRNVSMAGHRNGLDQYGNITDRAPFYYVDTLGEGDYFYITGNGSIYRYLYQETWVVESDDWSPIYTTDESCMTITSCEPIGISDHRIVVRALLDATFDESADFAYAESAPSEEEES